MLTNGTSTSEFKVTLLSQFIGMVLVSVGLIDPLESDAIVEQLLVVLGSITALVTSLLYIYSRLKLKNSAIQVKGIEASMERLNVLSDVIGKFVDKEVPPQSVVG